MSNEVLSNLLRYVSSLDPDLGGELSDSLGKLYLALQSDHARREQKVEVISAIVSACNKHSLALNRGARATDLRLLRNELAHGRSAKGIDYKYYHEDLWKTVLRASADMPSKELEDLLAYSTGVSNERLAEQGKSQKAIVSFYRAKFKKLPMPLQDEAFVQILMKFFMPGSLQLYMKKRSS
jgi:hypothetical protein